MGTPYRESDSAEQERIAMMGCAVETLTMTKI